LSVDRAGWEAKFTKPILLADGGRLATLRDAAHYIITALPKAEQEAGAWQTAVHVLIQAADHRGPIEFARLGVMQALSRHVERAFDASRKDRHWGRRKLKRDA
jgi:hypothetical protein